MKHIIIWISIIFIIICGVIGFRYMAEFHNVVYWIITIALIIIYPFSLDYPKGKIK